MDTVNSEKRSWIMAQVKADGNRSTEEKLVQVFRENGITGWRRRFPLSGKPDFVFPRQRLTIFVDGCFWHGHPTKCRMPQSNHSYWVAKIARNVTRDKCVTSTLKREGWKVIRIWEDSISAARTLSRIRKALS
jgi:DNA mismatch endonuclease (patch repair protein)